jgi:enoyl-CoA hydratase/carnithine racemase
VVAGDVTFGMLELRYGIVPDLGGNHRLSALVGPARAKELIWTTRRVDADEALRIGLANRVVLRIVSRRRPRPWPRNSLLRPRFRSAT